MPLAASMFTAAPVTRLTRSMNGIQGAVVRSPAVIVYCCVTDGPADRMSGSESTGNTPPDGRNVRLNDQLSPS